MSYPIPHYDSCASLAKLVLGFFLFYAVIHYVYWQLTVGSQRRRLIKRHSCKPINDTAELQSWKDSIFGWTQLAVTIQARRQGNLLVTNQYRFERNGNTCHFKIAFTNIIFTIEPENLKAILSVNFRDWNIPDRRKAASIPLLGNGIFTTDGSAWQHSRDLLRPNFVRDQVSDLATFEAHFRHLAANIPQDGSTVDMVPLFLRLTLDSATEFLFGESTNCLVPDAPDNEAHRFQDAFNRLQEEVGNAARGIPFFMRLNAEDIKTVHRFADHYVKLALARHDNQFLEKTISDRGRVRYVFLHELAKSIKDPIRLRSELLNVLLAGRDTTASLLGSLWFILANRPDIWTKLRQEVDALAGEHPTFEQLKNMRYLKYCLNETLRLYPVVPHNTRMSVTDTVLPLGGGALGRSPLLIPKGTIVGWSLYAMHRRKDFFGEDAEVFKPERWEKLRPGWEYLPFNGGPRICIGQQFALTEASYTTVRLMQEFREIESRDPGPWRECMNITAVARAAKVALTPA
ncbi:MAG: hypothetical protein Q9228_007030 [Teloschistes exilis]